MPRKLFTCDDCGAEWLDVHESRCHCCGPLGTWSESWLYTSAALNVPGEIIERLEYAANHLSDWHHIDEHSCKVNRRDLLTVCEALRQENRSND